MLLTLLVKNSYWEEFRTRARRAEALVVVAGLAVMCIVAFKVACFARPGYVPALVYLPLPFVIWAAVRFQTIGASAAIFIVTVVSIASALRGRTVFAGDEGEANVLSLQLFLIVLSGSILLLGAAVEELRRAEQITARLARSVLGVHDQERRLVARRVLDDIAQRLAAATWVVDPRPAPAVLEETLQQSILDLRKLSYLLHPAMLDEAGLEAALRAQLDKFAQCTGMEISLELTALGRLPADVELTIFRIVEEALANVKRHSRSTAARIMIERQPQTNGDRVVAIVEDDGRGMPWMARVGPAIQRVTATTTGWGLGLARMRERVHRLGGSLEISSANNRTTVRATIPLMGQSGRAPPN
jgi:signal transduction histidine kinase